MLEWVGVGLWKGCKFSLLLWVGVELCHAFRLVVERGEWWSIGVVEVVECGGGRM